MQITVVIEKCSQCRYVGHSGAFTSGGAKDICQGPNVIDHVGKFKKIPCPSNYIRHLNDKKSSLHKQAVNYIHWRHRTVKADQKQIPAWCPLKQGESY